jgi:hypothetical protein
VASHNIYSRFALCLRCSFIICLFPFWLLFSALTCLRVYALTHCRVLSVIYSVVYSVIYSVIYSWIGCWMTVSADRFVVDDVSSVLLA